MRDAIAKVFRSGVAVFATDEAIFDLSTHAFATVFTRRVEVLQGRAILSGRAGVGMQDITFDVSPDGQSLMLSAADANGETLTETVVLPAGHPMRIIESGPGRFRLVARDA
jgi:hypothetical protein